MSQFNLRFVPTLSCNEFILNGQRFNTQAANIPDGNGNIVATPALTTEVIINDATKNQVLFGEIYGNIHGNLFPQLQAEIDALDANVAILQGEVVVLQNEMNAVEGNVTILQGNVNLLEEQVAILSGNIVIDEQLIAELQRDTQFLEAPYNGLAGNTSFFWRGLQVYNTPTESPKDEINGTGFFSYLDGSAPASQIQLRVQDSKNVFVRGSTSIETPSGGLVNIAGNANSAMTFNVGNGSNNNVNVSMNGNIQLKGDSTSRVSVYTKSVVLPIPGSIKTAEIVGADEANVLGKKVTTKSDDGGQIVLDSSITGSGSGIQLTSGGTSVLGGGSGSFRADTGGSNVLASNGKGIDIQCDSGNSNSYINIGTSQGTTDTGYTTINIGNASSATLRTSSTFIDGDFYLPKVPINPAGYDNLMYIGLPTVFSGPLHGPVKSTFNPYFRSFSTFCPESTVNSIFQASGTFSVNVGFGAISLMTGTGGLACTCVAGLMAFTSLIGGIGMTTAGGAIALTTGAGIIQMTTGAAPIAMETNIGDILLKAGYSYQSTPELSLGSVYIQARDYSYITPDKGVIVGEGVPTPFNEVLLDTMNYPFSGNIFSNAFIAPMTGVFSNVFITPNSQTTLLNPVQSNLIYSNVLNETGSAFAILRNMDINGNIAVSAQATVPAGNVGANIAPTVTTTNFYFPASTTLPLNANVKLFVYIPDTPNIANYSYSTWQANVQVASNISGYVNAYVEPTPPSYSTYMTVLGNAAIQSDVGISGNLTVANPSFPAQSTVITRNSVTTTGNVTCNTLNYTTLNPPIVIPPQTAGVDSIIAGTNITISPLNGQGNVVINAIVPAAAGVNSIIAGNGIQVSPVGGQGNVTVSISGSLIPPGGYLPIQGGTMTGPIYQFPSSNITDNTIKKYRPVTSYQPPFPSIGPPTFTGEQLCFFNGDNSPEQTGFTGWFPQDLITGQPSAMTSPIAVSALQKFYQFVGGNPGSSTSVSAVIPNFKIGDRIKGGYFPYSALDEGLVGGANITFINTLNFKQVVLHQQFLQMPYPAPNSTTFPELDYTYTGGEQGDGSVNTAVFSASVDAQGEPFVTNNRNPANGDWEGYLNFAVNETTQFMAVTVDSTQAVIYEYTQSSQQVSKLITVGLTSGTYAAGEEAVGGIFMNPQRYADTKLIYFYGRFDTAILAGVTTVVNNIFAYNVDTNTIVTLKTNTTDPLYSATVPVGTNGRVNGVWVSQIIVSPDTRYSVYFWGDFTGPNQMGIATPPTGINWVNNGFAISNNDNWTVSQFFRPIGSPNQQQYLNCGAGCVNVDTAAVQQLNTQIFLFVGSFNGVTKNTVMSLGFDGATLTAFSTGFCFSNGGVGTSATNKVKNIILLGDRIYFLGNWTGTASNGTSDVPVYSLAATLGAGTFDLNTGIFSNPFIEVCGSSNTGFWLEDGVPIETTVIQTTDVNASPVNLLIGTQGYKVGNNGGGVLLFPNDQINDPTFLPTKEPILGSVPYEVRLIPTVNPPTAVQMTTSLNINNFWWSQTFNSTNPLIPPTAPTVNAINGAFFAVGNYEMTKIVFSGQDTDYNSVSFIAGDVEAGDKYWYWQAQVGAIDYYAGNTLYPNVTALGTTAVPTSDTLGAVMINGNIASTNLNMNNFDIVNANMITSANILTLLPVNAVEVGVGGRREELVTFEKQNTGALTGQNNFDSISGIQNVSGFSNPTNSIFVTTITVAFGYDDGNSGSSTITIALIEDDNGTETVLGSQNFTTGSGLSTQSVVFNPPITINPSATKTFFVRMSVPPQSPMYSYYGTVDGLTPYCVVTAQQLQQVSDPVEYFNVYGNSFFQDNMLVHANVVVADATNTFFYTQIEHNYIQLQGETFNTQVAPGQMFINNGVNQTRQEATYLQIKRNDITRQSTLNNGSLTFIEGTSRTATYSPFTCDINSTSAPIARATMQVGTLTLNNNSAGGSVITLNKDTISVATDEISSITSATKDATGTSRVFSKLVTRAAAVGAGNQDGTLAISTLVNGVLLEVFNFHGGENENNSFRPLDMNGNAVRTTQGNIAIQANASTGVGNISLQSKAGATINIDTGATGRINFTTLTATATPTHNVDFQATSNGITSASYLKAQLNGVDIWIPYLTTDPTV